MLIIGLFMLTLGHSQTASAITCAVSPEVVPILLRYNGADLSVTGTSKAGDDLIIRISNDHSDAHYKYKGKAAGLFWMKKGDVSFKNVPGVYMLYSTGEIDHLLNEETQKSNQIGIKGLKAASTMETESTELQGQDERWKNEFIRFKESQKLYAIHTGTVTRQHGQEKDTFQVDVRWPYQAGPGTYTVEALAIRNGQIVETSKSQFTVKRAGLVKKLSTMAFKNSALYGLMAVVIAIIAGFAVGIIFKKGGGAH